MDKNKVILSGKVGQDARIMNLSDGAQVARFILSTSEVAKDRNGNLRVETQCTMSSHGTRMEFKTWSLLLLEPNLSLRAS